MQKPLSKLSPEVVKLRVLARRLKKADDIMRMFQIAGQWQSLRGDLMRIRLAVGGLIAAQENKADA